MIRGTAGRWVLPAGSNAVAFVFIKCDYSGKVSRFSFDIDGWHCGQLDVLRGTFNRLQVR